jgi:hypothetical protein
MNRQNKTLLGALALAVLFVAPAHATSILFLGGEAGPTQGADAAVMTFLENRYGGANVTYLQASVANDSTDLDNKDVLVLSSTPGSGNYRNKYHNSAIGIVNWEEAVMDSGVGEFGLSSIAITKSTSTTQMNITGNHPITLGLSGTIDFVSGGETLSTFNLFPGLTSVAEAANGTVSGGGGVAGADVVGNPMIFIAEAGQDVDPASGASPAQGRRVMFPLTDSTFNNITPDGERLLGQAIDWVGVPEPSAWMLMTLSVAGLFGVGLRHKRPKR